MEKYFAINRIVGTSVSKTTWHIHQFAQNIYKFGRLEYDLYLMDNYIKIFKNKMSGETKAFETSDITWKQD